MNLPLTFDDLITEAEGYNLYTKLVKQLNKDLTLANVDLEFDEQILPSSLKLILHETLYHLIQERFADYLNLLYIVDVSENKVKELDGLDVAEMAERVAFFILLREWQKVWYRNNYS